MGGLRQFFAYRGRPLGVSLIEMRRYGNAICEPATRHAGGARSLAESLLTVLTH